QTVSLGNRLSLEGLVSPLVPKAARQQLELFLSSSRRRNHVVICRLFAQDLVVLVRKNVDVLAVNVLLAQCFAAILALRHPCHDGLGRQWCGLGFLRWFGRRILCERNRGRQHECPNPQDQHGHTSAPVTNAREAKKFPQLYSCSASHEESGHDEASFRDSDLCALCGYPGF